MVKSHEQGTSTRKSARLEKKRQAEFGESSEGTDLNSRFQFTTESEGELIVVTPLEEIAHSPTSDPDQEEWSERSTSPGPEGNVVSDSSEDEMPTRLKYSKFRGDGKKDVDEWVTEFESLALANQEEADAKPRIFQGLLKGEALRWYQDVPEESRANWDDFITTFRRTFREVGGEARAMSRLSQITMKKSESVRKYGQRVKALMQKLTSDVPPEIQVQWYVSGFPSKMGFQIRQTQPATLRAAMEAAQNYENSSQSLRKVVKISEKKKMKQYRKEKSRRNHSDSDDSSSSSESSSGTSTSESSESEAESSSRHRKQRHSYDRKDRGTVKVKLEKDKDKDFYKSVIDTLEAIKVNIADTRKPRKLVPTSRANVWCPRCQQTGHYPSECTMPAQKRIHYVNPEEEIYYTMQEEEEDTEEALVYQVHPTYGRGKAVQHPMRTVVSAPPIGSGQMVQARYPTRPPVYCYSCGNPDHYANACPFGKGGQGAPILLPCQNCKAYGHAAPFCPRPQAPKEPHPFVTVPPREQTALNYGHTAGTENPEK
jgi:hypothetical protein